MNRACALACLCLLPSFSQAQDGIIKNFDAAALERFIQEDLKKAFSKTENVQTASAYYAIKDTPYYATFNGRQRFVLFFVKSPAGSLTLQKINNWNRDAIFSRAYLQNNMYYLEVPLSTGTGVTRVTLKYYYDQFEAELKKFKANFALQCALFPGQLLNPQRKLIFLSHDLRRAVLKNGMRTLILSDIHLGNRHSNTALLNEVLDREPCDRLILNGDTLNSVNLRKLNGAHWALLNRFRKFARSRELILIRGNHDHDYDHAPYLNASAVSNGNGDYEVSTMKILPAGEPGALALKFPAEF